MKTFSEYVEQRELQEGPMSLLGSLAGGAAGILGGKKLGSMAGKFAGNKAVPILGGMVGSKIGSAVGAVGGGALGWKAGGTLGKAADDWMSSKIKGGAEKVADIGRSATGRSSENNPEYKQAQSSIDKVIGSTSKLLKTNPNFSSPLEKSKEVKDNLSKSIKNSL
jgi:hypothetical protein